MHYSGSFGVTVLNSIALTHPLQEEDLWEYLGCNENGQNFNGLIGNKVRGVTGLGSLSRAHSASAPRIHRVCLLPATKEMSCR